jgi:ABC-type transport system involved in multi-copper enzyme maturation permease subunit
MVGTLARKEFLEKLLTLRFFLAALMCVGVLPGLVLVRSWEYRARAQTYPKTVGEYRKRVAELPREFTWATFQHPVARPLNPMSILVEPVDLRDGGEVEILWNRVPNYLRSDKSNPLPVLFPGFDLLSFVTVVMSLLAVVFAFDSVCGEKEGGTLKLMMSHAVSRGTVLAGKWLGGMAALLLPFFVGSILTALVLLVTVSGQLAAGHWVELAAIGLVSVLFISVAFTGGLLVSALTAHAATSAALLLLLWALSFLVYPNLAPKAAGWLSPAPSKKEYAEEEDRYREPAYKEMQALDEEFDAKWEPVRNDPAMKNDYWIRKREIARRRVVLVNQVLGGFHEAVSRKVEKQVGVTAAVLRALPLGSYALAFDELAGTGAGERAKFLTAVGRYQGAFFAYFSNRSVEMMQRRKDEGLSDMPRYSAGDFPLFAYQETTWVERLSHSLLDVVLLAAWNVVLFLAAYARFLRYDVS